MTKSLGVQGCYQQYCEKGVKVSDYWALGAAEYKLKVQDAPGSLKEFNAVYMCQGDVD